MKVFTEPHTDRFMETSYGQSLDEFSLVDGEPQAVDLWRLIVSLSTQVCCPSFGGLHWKSSEASFSARDNGKAWFEQWKPEGIVGGLPQIQATRTILRLKGLRICGPGTLLPAGSQDLIIDSGVFQDPARYEGVSHVQDIEIYRGAFLHAGFIDLHTHLPAPGFLRLPELFALNYLAHGVTSIRSAGDITGEAVPAFFRAIRTRKLAGPRLFYSGPFIGCGRARWKNTLPYNDPSEAAAIIRGHVKMGASCVKLYENLTAKLIQTMVAQGEAGNLMMLGHVPTQLAVEDAGIPEPQHYFGVPPPQSLRRDHVVNRTIDWDKVDQQRLDQVVEHSLRSNSSHLPTLTVNDGILTHENYHGAKDHPRFSLLPAVYRDVVWHPKVGLPAYRNLADHDYSKARSALDKKLRLTNQLHKAGATLYLGTDTMQPFVVPGISLHEEMGLFAEAGIPRASVLEICTRTAGQRLQNQLKIGEISPGYAADFFLSYRSPLAPNWTPDDIEAVAVDGRIVDINQIRQTIKSAVVRCDNILVRPLAAFLATGAMNKLAQDFTG